MNKRTYALSSLEKETYVPLILDALMRADGKSVTNSELRDMISGLGYVPIGEIDVRRVVNHIRKNRLLLGLVADSSGYHVTKDAARVKSYVNDLQYREDAIRALKEEMMFQAEILQGQ